MNFFKKIFSIRKNENKTHKVVTVLGIKFKYRLKNNFKELESKIFDLRMDTYEDNQPMQHFLEKKGFEKCGIVYADDGTERLAYHKIIK